MPPRDAPPGARQPAWTLRENEIRLIREALEVTGWNKRRAAMLLGISRSTLYSKIQRYGIRPSPRADSPRSPERAPGEPAPPGES